MAEANVDALSFFHDKDEKQYFFTAIVSAEMRNKAYFVKLRTDESGEVLNSEDDCPAGMGPTATCKHVVAVLKVLISFVSDGILAVSGSCTDQLQTFKRPRKPHTGGPVPAEHLGKKTYNVKKDDDPRPMKYRNRPSYNDELYNATVNFAATSGVDVSWRYAFDAERYPRADLHEAQYDHYYLKDPFCKY